MSAVPPLGTTSPEIMWRALRADGPQYISQILPAKWRRRSQLIELGIDFRAAALGFDGRMTFRIRQQYGASKINFRRHGTILVIHRLQTSSHYCDFIYRNGSGWARCGPAPATALLDERTRTTYQRYAALRMRIS